MAQTYSIFRVTFAWWLRPYLYGVVLMCWLTGGELDPAKVEYWACKAIKCKAVR